MPLPFTNVWDTTVPLDSDEVNQGASDFRTLRTDVQQRMAAISGTDAAKPDFSADAQPTQWAGILYFATDTNRVYQWSGGFWNDVTSGIGSGGGGGGVSFGVDLTGTSTAQYVVGILGQPLPSLVPGYLHWNGTVWVFDAGGGGGGGGSAVLDRNTISITQSNSTTETTIFTTNVPALSSTAILRIRMNFVVDTFAAAFSVIWRWNGTAITTVTYTPGQGGEVMGTELFTANRTVTNNQQWNIYVVEGLSGAFTGGVSGEQVGETNIDTSVPTTLTFSVHDSAAGNTQTFNLWLVELL